MHVRNGWSSLWNSEAFEASNEKPPNEWQEENNRRLKREVFCEKDRQEGCFYARQNIGPNYNFARTRREMCEPGLDYIWEVLRLTRGEIIPHWPLAYLLKKGFEVRSMEFIEHYPGLVIQ